MYTKPKYPIAVVFKWTRRYIYIFALTALIPVLLYEVVACKWLTLPWQPIGLIGTALAFITGFKNNASYDRQWEARKIYGGIVNASRLFATMVNDFITNEYATDKKTDNELFQIRKIMILRHVSWMTSLRHALRQKKTWETAKTNKSDREHMKSIKVMEFEHTLSEELEGYLSETEKTYVLNKTNKQTASLNLQSKHIRELESVGLIDNFRHVEFKNIIGELFTLQGKAERIKNFPYPRQFATLNSYFIWIFIIIMPFGLMRQFDITGQSLVESGISNEVFAFIAEHFVWFTIPFSIIISWIFFAMERVGDTSENPFEGMGNDVPISTISRAIEIDIREMIEDNIDSIPSQLPEYAHTQM
ncbi:putative membrane protein [Maribacter vaceletii]|uniref:Putative membrane protein n=1 Tax=Maribacter vaceletii TaxID=1206816 RepID=A0A495E879_9FLAO|nr:bestrophin family ion channel [Maribacter vaceletii]RKR13134.1 putative membrane protein [Maribacter vaceletii]